MAFNPNNPDGSATSANSAPVVIASDQAALPLPTGAATSANQTNGTQQAKITDGTNVANVLASATPNATGNGMLTAGMSMSVAWSVTTPQAAASTDAGNYRWVSVQVSAFTSGTIFFQGSNDNTNWVAIELLASNVTSSTASSQVATTGVWAGVLPTRYFRLSITGAGSTNAGTVVFSSGPGAYHSVGVSGTVTATPPNGQGTGTVATSSTTLNLNNNAFGYGGFGILQVSGTYVGVSFVIAQSQDNGSTFYNVPVYDMNNGVWLKPGSTITPGTNATNTYWVPQSPFTNQTKLTSTAYTSGTMNVKMAAGTGALPGSTMSQIMDSAGNDRGANVDASGNLMVNVGAGTVSANAGTNLNTSALALETGGNLATVVTNTAHLTDGTEKAQVVDASGNVTSALVPGTANSSGNAILTAGTSYTYTINITAITPVVFDVGNYSYVSLQVNAIYSGQTAFFFESSNDNVNWYSNPLTYTNNAGGVEAVVNTTVAGIYTGPILGRYVRIRANGTFSSGAMTGNLVFKTIPTMSRGTSVLAAQTGSWTTALSAGAAAIGSITNTGFIAQQTDAFTGPTVMTITLASLASSVAGVGRQSTLVTSNTARSAQIAVKITTGTTPTVNTLFYVYLLRSNTSIADDNAGASDAGLTILNAPLLGTILCNSATSNLTYYGLFDTKALGSLGKSFGIAIVNSTGVALNATAGNHAVQYTLQT